MKNTALKLIFGLVIFLFGSALAYFTANYMGTTKAFDYWGTIAIFACAYVLVGILVVRIFAISLGFLFSADVLIISLLVQYYGTWAAPLKLTVVGAILAILYIVSALRLKDAPRQQAVSSAAIGQDGTVGNGL